MIFNAYNTREYNGKIKIYYVSIVTKNKDDIKYEYMYSHLGMSIYANA